VVDRSQRLVLALADRCLKGSKELRIFWRGNFHRLQTFCMLFDFFQLQGF
jgi:hypothetical protein